MSLLKQKNKKIRNISQNEIMYMDMQELLSPFIIQYIFRYEKPIDKNLLDLAISKVQKNFKDCFVKAKNNIWIEDDSPIKTVEMTTDVEDILTLDLFQKKTDFSEKTIEIYSLKNRGSQYLIFRLSHSVFDGKGAFLLLDNIFSYINDKEPTSCNNFQNDEDFIKDLPYHNKSIDISNEYHLKGEVKGIDKVRFKIFEIQKYCQAIIPKLAICLSSVFKENSVKFMIPTDIRKYKKDENIVSNLVLPTFINAGINDKWEDINVSLITKMNNNSELNKKSVKHFGYRYIPKSIRKTFLKWLFNYKVKQKSFMGGAIISHLGRVDFEKYKIKDNKPLSFCSLPVQQPLIPFSIVISEFENKTTIALSYYENQLEKKYLNELFETIDNYFNDYINYKKFNDTKKIFNENFIDCIFENAKKNPDKVCIYTENEQYTYKDLLIRSSQIAGYLKKQRIKYQDKIIINLNRSFDYIASILAVFKTGAIFIPVDKKENEFRINLIKEKSDAKLIINENSLNKITDSSDNNDEFYNYKAEDTIYCIYTSGTTGEPKEVRISLKNFSNYIFWANETYKTKNGCTMPLFTSLSVDLTMTSVFLPLISNGAIKIYKDEFSSLILDKIYNDNEINVIKCTPTHLTLFKNNNNIKPKEWLIVGGENFGTKIYNNIKKYNKNIVNEYGPTETTVGSCYYICDDNTNNYKNAPIGTPVFNTEIYLANENGEIIKEENKIGEIVISGFGLGDSDKKDNFRKFNDKDCYFTGDLGYFDNSILHCIGRKDFQVKINGQRLDLGEINSRILQIENIKAVETIYYNQRIFSFVVSDKKYTQKEITEFIENKIPKIALPQKIYFIDNIPLSDNGKTDRKKLENYIKEDYTKTKTDNEIKKLIQEIMEDEPLDLEKDTLHQMGVDSLGMLLIGQKLSEKYFNNDNKEKFLKEYISKISGMSVIIIEELINKYKK